MFLMLLVAGRIDSNLSLHLLAVVSSTFWCCVWWAGEGKGSLMPLSLAPVPGTNQVQNDHFKQAPGVFKDMVCLLFSNLLFKGSGICQPDENRGARW